MSVMAYTQNLILIVLTVAALAAAVVGLVHAAIQRKDAFPAVDRQSKTIWVAILAAATLFIAVFGATGLLGIIGVVATLVYLVDVRPRVDEIQGQHWFRKQR